MISRGFGVSTKKPRKADKAHRKVDLRRSLKSGCLRLGLREFAACTLHFLHGHACDDDEDERA